MDQLPPNHLEQDRPRTRVQHLLDRRAVRLVFHVSRGARALAVHACAYVRRADFRDAGGVLGQRGGLVGRVGAAPGCGRRRPGVVYGRERGDEGRRCHGGRDALRVACAYRDVLSEAIEVLGKVCALVVLPLERGVVCVEGARTSF